MSSFQGAPIMNNGYYDVPINNQYSNVEYRDSPIYTNEYQLNRNINVTTNDNKDEYVVYQEPTVPSKSLYLESIKKSSEDLVDGSKSVISNVCLTDNSCNTDFLNIKNYCCGVQCCDMFNYIVRNE